jgi:prophage regulatory protein
VPTSKISIEKRQFRVLTLKEVAERTSLPRTTIWRRRRADDFPEPIQLSPGRIGWPEEEIDGWLAERAAARQRRRKPIG